MKLFGKSYPFIVRLYLNKKCYLQRQIGVFLSVIL